jgi:hypothetical protein
MTTVTAEGKFPVAVCPSCGNLVAGAPSECWNGMKHPHPVWMVPAEAILVSEGPTPAEGGSGAGEAGASARCVPATGAGAASTPTGGDVTSRIALSVFGFDYWTEPGWSA